MARRVKRRRGSKRCRWGVNHNDGSCLMGPRRYKLKGRGRRKGTTKKKSKGRARDPQGSALYKDVMAFVRSGKKYACGSAARDDIAHRAGAYLAAIRALEERNGIDPSRADRRVRAIDQTSKAAHRILIGKCMSGGTWMNAPYARP